MNMEIPDSKLVDVTLDPNLIDEALRGGPVGGELKGWLQIGAPLFRELDAKSLGDSPLAAFVRKADGFRFVLMYFACSFRPADGEPFEQAWFNVTLGSTVDQAIAWSMTPARLTDDYKLTNSVTLGAELKLEPVAVKAERSTEREVTIGEVYIEALNLLAKNPIWELRATKARQLRGLHQLQLVARIPRNAKATATLSLQASVKRKALGLIPYAAAFERGAAQVVDVP